VTFGILLIFLVIWLLRVIITIYGFLRHPFSTLANIPRNWVRVALAIDMCHPPEPIPGSELNLIARGRGHRLPRPGRGGCGVGATTQ
jgi:hypothetical protein